MAVNAYFQNGQGFGSFIEQEMLRTLIDEAIKIKGIDVYYIPRKLLNIDEILGEDSTSYFQNGIPIEMYFDSIDTFGGKGDFITQFGLMVQDTTVLKVSKRRWQEVIGQYDLTLVPRPAEGDLIYLPFKNSSLLEIKYVDDRDPFYQLNDYYTYALTCTSFQFSHEHFTTGIDDIDNVLDFSMDTLDYQILLEDGTGGILLENGFSIIDESYNIDSVDYNANNTSFDIESTSVIDASETNLFGFE